MWLSSASASACAIPLEETVVAPCMPASLSAVCTGPDVRSTRSRVMSLNAARVSVPLGTKVVAVRPGT